MSNLVSGRVLLAVLCEALGLDANVVCSVKLECNINGIALVTVEQYARTENGEKLDFVLRNKYVLRPIEE